MNELKCTILSEPEKSETSSLHSDLFNKSEFIHRLNMKNGVDFHYYSTGKKAPHFFVLTGLDVTLQWNKYILLYIYHTINIFVDTLQNIIYSYKYTHECMRFSLRQ